MAVYLVRRLAAAVMILLGVSFITFFLLYVLPADPVRQIAGRSATAETVENIRAELGLDQPFLVQYGRYLGGLVQGDLGRSYLQRTEVSELIASRLPYTLQLMGASILISIAIGVPLGIYSAVRQYSRFDYVMTTVSFVGSTKTM